MSVELLKRAKIPLPVDQARNMLGVLDETGTLNYGEVYVQYTVDLDNPGTETKVLTGTVKLHIL